MAPIPAIIMVEKISCLVSWSIAGLADGKVESITPFFFKFELMVSFHFGFLTLLCMFLLAL